MERVDAIVVGAGFSGLRALYRLREAGKRVVAIEASAGVGGVWYHNGYPGARCDVESYDYSYSFSPELEQEWRWSERYATQPEILRYVNHVTDRFDLRRHIEFNTRLIAARFDETARRWTVTANDGRQWSAQFLVMCLGQLSTPKSPAYPGQTSFQGEIIHSAVWPKRTVDFAGKRVAIIGTGSSGMQMTPVIAGTAAHLTVFQRTANFSIPASNAPITDVTITAGSTIKLLNNTTTFLKGTITNNRTIAQNAVGMPPLPADTSMLAGVAARTRMRARAHDQFRTDGVRGISTR